MNDEINPVGSLVSAVAGAIINSFIVTHSTVITMIVTASVLTIALYLGRVHQSEAGQRSRIRLSR